MPKISTIDSTQSRQVQAPKYPYQLSASKPFSKSSEKSYIDESSNTNVSTVNTVDVALADSVNAFSSPFIETGRLPICLDVITSLNDLFNEPTINKEADDKTLPWLLFQGQCLLISAADWQSKLSLLFESHVLSSNVFKKDQKLNSAASINQQLATISTQMSAQDLAVFIVDVDELLINNAIKVIDRNRLVSLMLSSVSEQLHS